jgi:hypothetical protein
MIDRGCAARLGYRARHAHARDWRPAARLNASDPRSAGPDNTLPDSQGGAKKRNAPFLGALSLPVSDLEISLLSLLDDAAISVSVSVSPSKARDIAGDSLETGVVRLDAIYPSVVVTTYASKHKPVSSYHLFSQLHFFPFPDYLAHPFNLELQCQRTIACTRLRSVGSRPLWPWTTRCASRPWRLIPARLFLAIANIDDASPCAVQACKSAGHNSVHLPSHMRIRMICSSVAETYTRTST